MPVVKLENLRINYLQLSCEYEVVDGKEPEDLIMIHGLATNMAFWYMHIATAFTQRYRVTLYDLRGHGRSSMPSSGYKPQSHAEDLVWLMQELDIKKAHFVAHSFGAVVALQFAISHQNKINSLVLADAHISAIRNLQNDKRWKFGENVQRILQQCDIDLNTVDPYFGYRLLKVLADKQLKGDSVAPELLDMVSPIMGGSGKKTASQWLKLLSTTSAENELLGDDEINLDQLKQFEFPILALYGERSQSMTTGEKLLTVWPHARFVNVKEEGHFFPVSQPDKVFNECFSFWRRPRLKSVMIRNDDVVKRNFFRSSRFTQIEGQYYFSTRESQLKGPYPNLTAAQQALDTLIRKAGLSQRAINHAG